MTSSLFRDVAQAKSPRDAIFMLANAIDKLNQRLDKLEDARGEWDSWGDDTAPTWDDGRFDTRSAPIEPQPAPPRPPTDDEVKAWIAKNYDKADLSSIDPATIAGIRNDIMGTQAYLATLPDMGDMPYDIEDGGVVHFHPVDEETQNARRHFAEHVLRLNDAYGPAPEGALSWVEHYVEGGPMWLYMTDRDLVLAYDDHVKAMMIDDVLKQSPKAAHEMSIDILRETTGEVNLDNPGGKLGDSDDVKKIQEVPGWQGKD